MKPWKKFALGTMYRVPLQLPPAAFRRGLVFWWGGGLSEGDEVAFGVLDGEFAHAVEGGALGHDPFYVFHGRHDCV